MRAQEHARVGARQAEVSYTTPGAPFSSETPCSSTLPRVFSDSVFAPSGSFTRAKATSAGVQRLHARTGLPSASTCTEPPPGCARKKSLRARVLDGEAHVLGLLDAREEGHAAPGSRSRAARGR